MIFISYKKIHISHDALMYATLMKFTQQPETFFHDIGETLSHQRCLTSNKYICDPIISPDSMNFYRFLRPPSSPPGKRLKRILCQPQYFPPSRRSSVGSLLNKKTVRRSLNTGVRRNRFETGNIR